MKVNADEQRPIKMWLDDIEDSALNQARNLANLPFAFKHIAIMPDAHTGYGMPIGGVLATKKYVIPNAVGVDIGCGMRAVRTSLQELDTDTLKAIMGDIRTVVPVGFDHHKKLQDESLMPGEPVGTITERQFESALHQLGTLGGGNHFIEIQRGDDGYIWLMIHSGSRNFGFKTAKYYNDLAIKLNEKWCVSVPKEHELAFLPMDSPEGKDYIREMQYCVDFAAANRGLMLDRVMSIVGMHTGAAFDDAIDIAHNYARMENHFKQNVMLHRKGATRAYAGEIGIIPGSQGTASYIVKGLGNPESFMSCSHGAGRTMGRKHAIRTLDLEAEKKRLDDKGIVHSIRNQKDLDEAPSAYKDIEVVMANQTDLVEIVTRLEPMGVIKA